ncbi:M28 family peptidase [Sphingomonas sp.]|uniref:M28 family peptidase n=1 Tax=Sphingomonas sp. TaxID=28214 RepID=UPI001B04AE33|nr:M28 family peptidase [Sphingomonas sp.]MBO9711989.1 M20/M25/M40 family metallo-hydrolase [Sphingomonas sp.]
MRDWLAEHRAQLIALAVVLALFATPVIMLLWMTAVPGRGWSGPLPPLTADEAELARRLRTHVEAIGKAPHNLGHPEALERAARYLEGVLASGGYAVVRQPFDEGRARNLEVTIEPADPRAPTLVIGAHYDSAFTAPGANDNGSGTAAVLELARRLADLRGKASRRIRLVLFVNEEPPFFQTERMGSLVYAHALRGRGEPVEAMFSLETLGCYSDAPGSQRYPFPPSLLYPGTGNFVAFVGTLGSRALVRRATADFRRHARFPSEGGAAPALIQGVDWSDHWSFEQLGYPAIMVTDTAPFRYRFYHDTQDTPDKLDYPRLARVVAGLEQVIRHWNQGAAR